MQPKLSVAVIGAGRCSAAEAELAETIGRSLARRGVILICGGLGGVMEAACKGAAQEGGATIGILPGNDASEANPYVQTLIVTGIGFARNQVVVKSAHAVIAIGGAYGTLSEIAYALQANIPIVGVNTWSLSRNGEEETAILRADDAETAVEMAVALAQSHLPESKTPKGKMPGNK